MGAPQGAPCRRAGGQWVRRARGACSHGGGPRCVRAVLPCCPGFARSPRPQRLWVHSWGSATQHGAGCGVQFVRSGEGAGVAGAGCDGAARAADAVSAPPPSGKCGGGAWPWRRTREAMEERVPSSATGSNYSRLLSYLVLYILRHPEATPRLKHPCRCSQCQGQCKVCFFKTNVRVTM